MNSNELKAYKNIDTLPYWNFDKARNTGDLRYLLKMSDYDEIDTVEIKDEEKLSEIWEKLFDQYLDYFGIPDQLKEIVEIKKQIAILEAELVLYNKLVNRTFIEVKKKQLETIQGTEDSVKSIKFEEQVVSLERWLKISIDERKITTIKFLNYLQDYIEEANKLNIQKLKNG